MSEIFKTRKKYRSIYCESESNGVVKARRRWSSASDAALASCMPLWLQTFEHVKMIIQHTKNYQSAEIKSSQNKIRTKPLGWAGGPVVPVPVSVVSVHAGRGPSFFYTKRGLKVRIHRLVYSSRFVPHPNTSWEWAGSRDAVEKKLLPSRRFGC